MKAFRQIDDQDREFHYQAWHFSWDDKEIVRLKEEIDQKLRSFDKTVVKLVQVHAMYKPSSNPLFVSRGNEVSPYLKIEMEAPASNDFLYTEFRQPEVQSKFKAALEELDDFLLQLKLHQETLSRPIQNYVPRWRPGVKVSIRYGDYMNQTGVIVGDGERPETHQLKLGDGRLVYVDEDLMQILGEGE